MQLLWPCIGRRITSSFGPRTIGDGFHDGLDIAPEVRGIAGDPVSAAHGGIIVEVRPSQSYGNMVVIDGTGDWQGYSSIYGHLLKSTVRLGDKVGAGDVIGYMGNTGASTGVHLHFELRNVPRLDNDYWVSKAGRFLSSIDPAPYLVDEIEEDEEMDQSTFNKMYQAMLKETHGDEPSTWAKEACKKAQDKGVFNGDGKGNYDWQEPITREAVSVLLNNLGLLD